MEILNQILKCVWIWEHRVVDPLVSDMSQVKHVIEHKIATPKPYHLPPIKQQPPPVIQQQPPVVVHPPPAPYVMQSSVPQIIQGPPQHIIQQVPNPVIQNLGPPEKQSMFNKSGEKTVIE